MDEKRKLNCCIKKQETSEPQNGEDIRGREICWGVLGEVTGLIGAGYDQDKFTCMELSKNK